MPKIIKHQEFHQSGPRRLCTLNYEDMIFLNPLLAIQYSGNPSPGQNAAAFLVSRPPCKIGESLWWQHTKTAMEGIQLPLHVDTLAALTNTTQEPLIGVKPVSSAGQLLTQIKRDTDLWVKVGILHLGGLLNK